MGLLCPNCLGHCAPTAWSIGHISPIAMQLFPNCMGQYYPIACILNTKQYTPIAWLLILNCMVTEPQLQRACPNCKVSIPQLQGQHVSTAKSVCPNCKAMSQPQSNYAPTAQLQGEYAPTAKSVCPNCKVSKSQMQGQSFSTARRICPNCKVSMPQLQGQ
jgi:hypothetical protein